MANDTNLITPHLHKYWHLGNKLVDIADPQRVIRRLAAKAFVYGFVYDLIFVATDGSVEYGDGHDDAFLALEPNGIRKKQYLSPKEQLAFSDGVLTRSEKHETLNGLLFDIYEDLTVNRDMREAIIKCAQTRFSEDKRSGGVSFILSAGKAEPIAAVGGESGYHCILDVIDGYYHGSAHKRSFAEGDAADADQFMFDELLRGIFDQLRVICADDMSALKKCYYDVIDALYSNAVCDDVCAADPDPNEPTGRDDALMSVLRGVLPAADRPFADGGRFSCKKAKASFDAMLASLK